MVELVKIMIFKTNKSKLEKNHKHINLDFSKQNMWCVHHHQLMNPFNGHS